jgi:chemotaxis protein CheD
LTLAALAGPLPVPREPAPVRGFEGIHRYFEFASGMWIAQIVPGESYVTRGGELISTVLGSCISTCMRDAEAGVGGMNHFMLPHDPSGGPGASGRYGLFAMEQLINALMKCGARRQALEVKIFGAGRVIPGTVDVGGSNLRFVRRFLQDEGIPLAAEDVGLEVARRVRYRPQTGQVRVLHLPMTENGKVAAREAELESRLRRELARPMHVELF